MCPRERSTNTWTFETSPSTILDRRAMIFLECPDSYSCTLIMCSSSTIAPLFHSGSNEIKNVHRRRVFQENRKIELVDREQNHIYLLVITKPLAEKGSLLVD